MSIQYARPIEDIITRNWTTSSGTDYYALVDESVANDSDYIICSDDAGASSQLLELKLSSIDRPVRDDGLILWVRAYSASGTQINLTVSLRQGATVLAQKTFTDNIPNRNTIFDPAWDNGFATLGFFIPPSAVALIDNWSDLRVGLIFSSMLAGEITHISQVYLEAPPSIHTNQAFVPDAILAAGGWVGAVSTVETYDGNYLVGDRNSTTVRLGLPSIADPATSTGHVITTVFGGDSANESTDVLSGYLYQGTTLIATLFSGIWANENPTNIELAVNYELTAAEADSITDYSDLEIHFDNTTNAVSEDYEINSVYLTLPKSVLKVFPGLISFSQTVYSATVSFTAPALIVEPNLISFSQTVYSATVPVTAPTANTVTLTKRVNAVTVNTTVNVSTSIGTALNLTTGVYSPTVVTDQVFGVNLVTIQLNAVGAAAQPFSSNNVDLYDGLVSYWPLDEALADKFDAYGNNTLNFRAGTPVASTTDPVLGARCLEFDTLGEYINDSDLSGSPDIDSFAVSVWAKPVDLASKGTSYRGVVFLLRDGLSNEEIALRVSGNTDDWEVYNWATSTVVATGSGSASTDWSHLVVTQSPENGLSFYINGSLVDTGAHYDYGLVDQFWLSYSTTTYGFDGFVDEVGFWDRELTASEVSQLYNSGNGLAFPFPKQTVWQVALTDSDIDGGSWTLSTGTTYYNILQPGVTGYAINDNQIAPLKVGLQDISEPLVNEGFIVKFTALAGGSNANQRLTVQLRQGNTLISSREFDSSTEISSHDWSFDYYDYDLWFSIPAADAATITDYTNLALWFIVSNQAASEVLYLYEAALYAPPAAGQFVTPDATISIPSGWSVTGAANAHTALSDGENSTYVRSRDDVEPLIVEFAPMVDPGVNSGVVIGIGVKGASANELSQDGVYLALKQGTSNIANLVNNYLTQVETHVEHLWYELTPNEIVNITDWSLLRLQVSMGLKDANEGFDIEYAYIFAPDPVYIAKPNTASLSHGVYSVTVAEGARFNAAVVSLTVNTLAVTVATDQAVAVNVVIFTKSVYSVTAATGTTATTNAVQLNIGTLTATANIGTTTTANNQSLTLAVNAVAVNTATSVTSTVNFVSLQLATQTATGRIDLVTAVNTASLTANTQIAGISLGITTTVNTTSLTTAVYGATASTGQVITVNAVTLTEGSYGATAIGSLTVSPSVVSFTKAVYSVAVNTDQIVTTNLVGLITAVHVVSVSNNSDISVAVQKCPYNLSAYSVTVSADQVIAANTAQLTLSANVTAVSITAYAVGELQSLIINTSPVTVIAGDTVAGNLVGLTLGTLNATIITHVNISGGLQTLTLSTDTVTVNHDAVLSLNQVSYTLASYAATANQLSRVRIWDGNAFVERIVKTWDGNAWVTRVIKVFNGTWNE